MSKKRANGEGSIRKRPNGRWEGRYTQGFDPITGKAIQKSVSAKTQAECKEELRRAIRENRGVALHNHNGDYTVAEWCRLWFDTYENVIEQHIIPKSGMVKIQQLTSLQIQRMCNEPKTNGHIQRFKNPQPPELSNSYVRRIHMVLRAALQQAVDERLIPTTPVRTVASHRSRSAPTCRKQKPMVFCPCSIWS